MFACVDSGGLVRVRFLLIFRVGSCAFWDFRSPPFKVGLFDFFFFPSPPSPLLQPIPDSQIRVGMSSETRPREVILGVILGIVAQSTGLRHSFMQWGLTDLVGTAACIAG